MQKQLLKFPWFFLRCFQLQIKLLLKSEKSPWKRLFLSQKSNSCKISPLQTHGECHYPQTQLTLVTRVIVHHLNSETESTILRGGLVGYGFLGPQNRRVNWKSIYFCGLWYTSRKAKRKERLLP